MDLGCANGSTNMLVGTPSDEAYFGVKLARPDFGPAAEPPAFSPA
jgi:hypothetical protein